MRRIFAAVSTVALWAASAQAETLEQLLVANGVITKAEAAATKTTTSAPKIYYNEGTRIEFPDQAFDLKINTLIIGRYTFTDADQDAGRAETSTFDVAQARLVVSGTALNKQFAYLIQTDLVGTRDDGRKEPDLRDAFIDWSPIPTLSVRVGQFKLLYPRSGLNSDAKLQFPVRSESALYFDEGRQAGAMTSLDLAGGLARVHAAIFNGNSDNEGFNRSGLDTHHLGQAGIRVNPLGKMNALEEGDVNSTAEPALSFGAFYGYNDAETQLGVVGGPQVESIAQTIAGDVNFKYRGLGIHGEYFWREIDVDTRAKTEPMGGYLQAGYFLVPSKLEAALRYSLIDCDDGTAPGRCAGLNDVVQGGAALNYFWWKHSAKVQMSYDYIEEDPIAVGVEDYKTNRWVLELVGFF